MRLIDAEPIEKAIAEWKERETNEPLTMTIVENVGTRITHAPTVNAIPIEWLIEYGKKRTINIRDIFIIIDDWREENGKQEKK